MSEPETTLQTINGIQARTAVTGDGVPVLALHGWGGSVKSFWPIAEALAKRGYEVHLLDMPGFGESALPPETWGVADYMRFTLAYLDTHDLDRIHLIGHSFGGRIGLMLAAEHPDRVIKMVLADSAGLRTPPSTSQRLRQFAARTTRGTLSLFGLSALRQRLQDRYNQRYASEDYLTAGPLRDTFLRVIEQDLSPYATRVQAPTVLIWGDQDLDTPLWQGRKLEQLIPDAGLVVFQGAGHFAYLERQHDFIRITDHFFSDRS